MDLYISTLSGDNPNELKTKVEEAIESAAMVCRDLLVKWHEDLKRNVRIEFTGPYTAEEVDAVARDYILRIRMGGRLQERRFYAHLDEKFNRMEHLEIIQPTRDIVASGTAGLVQKIIPADPADADGFVFEVVKND